MQPHKDNAQKYSDIPSLNEAWLDWLATPAGFSVSQQEKAMLESVLPSLRGYALAIASLADPEPLIANSKTAHQWWLKAHQCTQGSMTSVQIDALQWPFEDDSLDVVILHHTLDYAQWPHQTLREAARCLNASGHLVVIGNNPYSYWGIGRLLLGRWSHRFPWLCRFISPWRIADWLTLLDCRVMRAYYTRPLLPWSLGGLVGFLKKLGISLPASLRKQPTGFWPGSSYMLLCKPETPSLTPIQKDWRRRQFTGLPIAGRSFNVEPSVAETKSCNRE